VLHSATVAAPTAVLLLHMHATPLPVQATTNPIKITQQTGSDNPFDAFALWSYSTPAFVDLNGDGDQDMLSGESAGAFVYFENTSPISQSGDATILCGGQPFVIGKICYTLLVLDPPGLFPIAIE